MRGVGTRLLQAWCAVLVLVAGVLLLGWDGLARRWAAVALVLAGAAAMRIA